MMGLLNYWWVHSPDWNKVLTAGLGMWVISGIIQWAQERRNKP